MKDFKNKYNFDIEYEKNDNDNKVTISPEYKEELNNLSDVGSINKIIDESNYQTNTQKNKFNDLEKYKITLDNMTEYQKLIKRIEINKKLIKLFIDNYYLDDFNNTRRGFYFCFSIPFLTFFGFLILNPFNPLKKICFLISLLGPTAFTTINYKNEMDLLGTKNTNLGYKVLNFLLSLIDSTFEK